MKKLTELVADMAREGFIQCYYAAEYGMAALSDRPDLGQFQCNGALAAARTYKKAPFIIASEITEILKDHPAMKEVSCVAPGFINMTLTDRFLLDYLEKMSASEKYGCESIGEAEYRTILVDYGGPNIAKPLHVGHLRSANIGESLKRMGRFLGYHMLGDVHLGDWGLQIGLIIAELKQCRPGLGYDNANSTDECPDAPPFTISELEEIYPRASNRAKYDPDFLEEAKQATFMFQSGHKGYVALWQHILDVSVKDLKKNYADLNVTFDLWKKESDAQPFIPDMIEGMKRDGHARYDDGALIVDVKEDHDTREIPPCILVKSDGATLYSTTDLATIVERVRLYNPAEIIYVVDKRQELHFEQVFRCARKTGLVSENTRLTFLGFGTMNGQDGKPFKTRDGGTMRLEQLMAEACEKAYQRIMENREDNGIAEDEARAIATKVGLAAVKYSDLSSHYAKDYAFDLDRFTSSEGNTGPYIIYTLVRIKSIIKKILDSDPDDTSEEAPLLPPSSEVERRLMLKLALFSEAVLGGYREYSPHKICQYAFELSNECNSFYHQNRIITEEDAARKQSWVKLITLAKGVLITCLDLLGIEAPERM